MPALPRGPQQVGRRVRYEIYNKKSGGFIGNRSLVFRRDSSLRTGMVGPAKRSLANGDEILGDVKGREFKGARGLYHKEVMAWPQWAPRPVGRGEWLEKGTILWTRQVKSYELKPEAIKVVDPVAVVYYRLNWTDPEGKNLSRRMTHFWGGNRTGNGKSLGRPAGWPKPKNKRRRIDTLGPSAERNPP